MTTTAEFDADLTHPWAQRWRIPRVTSPYPDKKYEVALCVPDPADPSNLWGATEPSEEEARIVAWFLEWRMSYYREGWQAKMRERPFDIDSGTNTVILMRAGWGWTYRRMTYDAGPRPYWNEERRHQYPPNSDGLLALLDYLGECTTWPEWKAEHPLPAEEGTQV